MLEAHEHLFVRALPNHSGRFRTGPVAYGHGGHERHGVDVQHIELTMTQCYEDFFSPTGRPPAASGKKEFSRWAALFLERFLDIHPFDDGNGRIARLWVDFAGRRSVNCVLRQDGNARIRKRYRNALEYAHLYQRGSQSHRGWIIPLSEWVESRLIGIHAAEPDEPPTGSSLRKPR